MPSGGGASCVGTVAGDGDFQKPTLPCTSPRRLQGYPEHGLPELVGATSCPRKQIVLKF